jgi:MFS family permease
MDHAAKIRLIPYVMGTAVLLQTIDATAIATGLPAMARTFNIDPVTASFAITSYLIGTALTVPAGGWLADRFGGREVFRFAALLVIVTSLICAAAPNFWTLIGARFVGGAASASMLPIGRLMVVRSVPRDRMLDAVTTFATIGLVGPMLGPVMGGTIVQYIGWRAIFVGIALLGLLVMAALTIFTSNDRQEHPGRLDIVGLLMSGIGLASIVIGMEMLGRGGGQPWTAVLLVGGLTLLLALFFHARRMHEPLIRVRLLERPILLASILADFPIRMVIACAPLLVSLYLQVGLGQSALLTGTLLLAPAIGNLLMKPAVAFGSRRYGLPLTMSVGALMGCLSFACLAMIDKPAFAILAFVPLALHGLGRAIVVNGGTILNFAQVEPEEMGAVTGLTSLFQQTAMVVGVGSASLLLRVFSNGPVDRATIGWTIIVVSMIGLMSILSLYLLPRQAAQISR